jgi:hypothetical protein
MATQKIVARGKMQGRDSRLKVKKACNITLVKSTSQPFCNVLYFLFISKFSARFEFLNWK